MTLYEELQYDIPEIEKKFPAIAAQIVVLDKYDVEIKDIYRKLEHGMPATWMQYLETLEQANKMINYTKVLLKKRPNNST